MATKIRKCANPKCSDIIGTLERPNKKYCSEMCKTRAHNDKNSKEYRSWGKVFEEYYDQSKETFISLDRWLKQNYYPPRIIKQKK
jgi:hypothetical protein